MSELGGSVEDLLAKGPISKYAQGVPAATEGPIPEVLKNYLDVSMGVSAWGGGRVGSKRGFDGTDKPP